MCSGTQAKAKNSVLFKVALNPGDYDEISRTEQN